MIARGKREARRPWIARINFESSTESAKYQASYSALSELNGFVLFTQGRRAPLRVALAPGFHISRLWRFGSDQLCTKSHDNALLCATSVFSVTLWLLYLEFHNHRDTENTEVAQRNP
jgi:hypothetical protein